MAIELPERDRWTSAADVAALARIRDAVLGRRGPVAIRITQATTPIVTSTKIEA